MRKRSSPFFIAFAISFFGTLSTSASPAQVVYWNSEDTQRLEELYQQMEEKLQGDADPAEIRELFDEFSALLLSPRRDVVYYLAETFELCKAMGKDNRGEQILELRNRLDEIYSSWLLRFEPVIEREILSVLEKLALEGESSYVRMEAVMAIGSIGRADSLPVLEKAAQDPDELVRKYARKAIEKIQNPNSRRTYDDVIEVLEYWTKKPVKK